MRYKTLFRLAVKFLGIWLIAIGLAELMEFVFQIVLPLLVSDSTRMEYFGPRIFLLLVSSKLAYVILGLLLIFRGEWLVNLAIPSNRVYCHECGYDLSRCREMRCPECGTHVSNEQRESLVSRRLSDDEADWRVPARAAEECLAAGDLDGARRHLEVLKGIHPRLRVIAELEARLGQGNSDEPRP